MTVVVVARAIDKDSNKTIWCKNQVLDSGLTFILLEVQESTDDPENENKNCTHFLSKVLDLALQGAKIQGYSLELPVQANKNDKSNCHQVSFRDPRAQEFFAIVFFEKGPF